MKKTYTLLLLLLATVSILAQSPEKMSYQAVLRDASNTLLTNQEVGMQISILQTTITGTAVYIETQTATTNINGLVSIAIGSGTSSDTFSAIDWSAGPYFIKTATDPSGGSSYTITGTSQIMSVPFALYAKTSGSSEANATNISSNTTDITTNTTAITANTAKVGYTEALVSGNTAVVGNSAKVGITTDQASEITTNTAKTGVTSDQSTAITTNTAKVGYTEALVSANTDVAANTLKAGYTEALVSANTAVAANTLKVDTDATSVNAAGALMDSEVTDLAGIKALQISTLQVIPSEGAFVDGDKTKLDGTDALIASLEARIADLESVTPATVGDSRAGGVVFWVDPTDNTHGLVCVIEDQSSAIRWYNGEYTTTGATGTAIGTGSANTTAIITEQGTPEISYAAGLARAYRGGGYTDWFLPSKDELNEMYQNKATINTTATANGGSNFTDNLYWSSTEIDVNVAWNQFFFNGFQGYNGKNVANNSVRAVRAF
jgi:hypothetical protein